MRLLLDTNLSPTRIGAVLEEQGHEVPSLASDPVLGSLDDERVLELAAEQNRILVTRNSRDFAPLLRAWGEAGRHHAGCILIWTLGHNQFAAIITGVVRLLEGHPDPEQWQDLSVAL